jgi:hypothetical protein
MGWNNAASKRRNALKKSFADDLNGIAECLANHNEVSVAETHVNQAFQALSNSGLYRRRWIDRPEAEMSVGTFFMGLAFACPDAISVFVGEQNRSGVSAGLFTFFLLFGGALFGHAAWRARLPAPPPEVKSWKVWRNRILISLLIACALFAGGYYAYQRFIGCCVVIVPRPNNEQSDGKQPEAADLPAEPPPPPARAEESVVTSPEEPQPANSNAPNRNPRRRRP